MTRESANFSESLDKATVSRVAGIAAELAADKGCPQSMSYFVTPDGRIYIHTLHDLLLRQRAATPVMKKEEEAGLRGPEEKHYAEDELLDIAAQGREKGFACALIRDAGLTEFHGDSTFTCLAFEPLYPEQIDPITGELPLF